LKAADARYYLEDKQGAVMITPKRFA